MTVPKHFKFTFRGVFAGSPEEWSFGVKFDSVHSGDPDAHLDNIDSGAVTSAITTFLNGPHVGQHVVLVDWRAYEIGADGRMLGNGPLLVTPTANSIKGSGQSWQYPAQISLAITTVADNRGPAKLNRFYLPGPTRTLGSDGRLAVADTQDYASRAVDFLKGISGAIDFPISLRSSAGVNISDRPAGAGTIQEIDHVEVGRVYDIISTRRNQLLEARERSSGSIDW